MTPTSFSDYDRLRGVPFEQVPAEYRARVYGLEYVRLQDPVHGQLFLTRYGWPLLDFLRPERWYTDQRYARIGERLSGGTGTVYRVPIHDDTDRRRDFVLKFSRFAQDVPLQFSATFPEETPKRVMDEAEFNDPFLEFGLLHDLRRGRFGPPELRIMTKRPMAIYSPPKEYREWQLGRHRWIFEHQNRALVEEQQWEARSGGAVSLNYQRDYLLLFEWVKGLDAEALHDGGALSQDELVALSLRVTAELKSKGFRVLDNKPRHYILRPRRDGSLLYHDGSLAYALVDFELLQRIPEYEAFLRQGRLDRAAGI